MRGRSPLTIFGVNAFDTSRRKRVWSGGSMLSIACEPRSTSPGACSANIFMRSVGVALSTCTLSDGSRRVRTMSS